MDEINDYSETFAPTFLQLKRTFSETGTISLWRWDIFSGVPLFGDPVTMLLYPLNLLALFIEPFWLFPILILASFCIGAVGGQKVLRLLGISTYRALFFGIAYMLMPLSIAHIKAGHINLYEAFSLCPWVFYFLIKWIKTKKKGFLLGASIAHSYVLFTHPTMFFILAVFLVSLFILFKPSARLKYCVFYLFIVFILGAAFLFPTIEFSNYITRTHIQPSDIVPVWTFKSFIGGLFFPYPKIASLDQESILYPGLFFSVFSLMGLWSLKKYRTQLIFMILVALLFSLGNTTPIYSLLLRIMPYESIVRVSTRFWYMGIWILVACAAVGSQRLKKRSFYMVLMVLTAIELIAFSALRLGLPGRYGRIENLHFYDSIKNSQGAYRIYATTRDLRQRVIAQERASLADGEYPLQLKSYIKELKSAGGYSYKDYSVMYPPYQIFSTKPQPNPKKLGILNILYVISSYPLTDPMLVLTGTEKNLFIYKNTAYKPLMWSEDTRVSLVNTIVLGNTFRSTYTADSATNLKVGVPWYPGWIYTVDTMPIDIDIFNSYIEFTAPAGTHIVEARFKSTQYLNGLKVTTVSLLVLALLLVYTQNSAFLSKKSAKNL